MKRAVVTVIAMAGMLVMGVAPASAHPSPANCSKSGLALNIDRSQTLVANGDTVTYQVYVANDAAGSCDVTGATVNLYLPTATGQPSTQPTPVVMGANYTFGFHEAVVASVRHQLVLNPGVRDATVRATLTGTLHDNQNEHPLNVIKELGTDILAPTLTLAKAVDKTTGAAPLGVTYTYAVTNTSVVNASVRNLAVSDDLCSPVTYAGGDGNGDGLLNPGETFTFTCTTTHGSAGTYVDTATACGDTAMGGERVCSPPAQARVDVSAPPTPVSLASKPDKCISIPKRLSVRAKELTTVKVTVTAGRIAGATIRLTGPGIKRTGKTNSKGQATFKVRPTRKGTLTVSSDSCLDAERVSVKAARKTQSRRVPRVTG